MNQNKKIKKTLGLKMNHLKKKKILIKLTTS